MADPPTQQAVSSNVITELADGSGRYIMVRGGAAVSVDMVDDGSLRISSAAGTFPEVWIFQSNPANGLPFTEHTA